MKILSLSFILMATRKIFEIILKLHQKIVKFFQKRIFLQANFFVHHVVVDTQKLIFFPFLRITIFKQAKKFFIFSVWNVYICLDQCLII